MVLIRWGFIFIVSVMATVTDIKFGKISNRLSGITFIINLVLLMVDYNIEYVIAFVISLIANIFLLDVLYKGGDAKIMINIAFAIGYKALYVFISMLMILIIVYVIKMIMNFIKNKAFRTAGTTICCPSILGGVICTFWIFYI